MGYNVSWLAFRGCERNVLLRELGLVATGETSDYPRGMECGSSLPDNTYLLFLNHPRHRFTEPGTLAALSQNCEVFGCRIEEFNMSSAAFCWKNGECAWSVVHAAVRDVRNLKTTGTPPVELEPIQVEANRLQDDERKPFFLGFLRAQIDHFFRVPIDLAAKAAGYEHDRIKQPWGKAKYEILQPGSLQ
jgi:hypothetical protein